MTNGYWATSLEETRKKLLILKQNGLVGIGVSYDKYHSKFLEIENLKNLILVCEELDLRITIKSVQTKELPLSKIIESLEDVPLFEVDFQMLPLYPYGNAVNISQDVSFLKDIPEEKGCPFQSLTFFPKGEILPCCQVGAQNLKVGELSGSLEYKKHFRDLVNDPILSWIRKNNFKSCIDLLDIKEQERVRKKKYINACHLCHEIFSNAEYKALLLDEFHKRKAQKIIKQLFD